MISLAMCVLLDIGSHASIDRSATLRRAASCGALLLVYSERIAGVCREFCTREVVFVNEMHLPRSTRFASGPFISAERSHATKRIFYFRLVLIMYTAPRSIKRIWKRSKKRSTRRAYGSSETSFEQLE